MGVQAIKKLKRHIPYTATWASGVMTVTTSINHNLKSTDVVSFILPTITNELNNVVITVTGVNTFTVPFTSYQQQQSAHAGFVVVEYFSAGQTGDQDIFTITPTNSSLASSVIQFTAHGAAGAVLVLSVSNDMSGWVQVATVTLASTDKATDFVSISNNWNYGKLSITSIGAATAVVVTIAS